MNKEFKLKYPERIICLTEESAEILYALGLEHKIVGVSSYAKRPSSIKSKPKICTFLHAKIEKIIELEPDLVIGYSDLQATIAKQLIEKGISVFISQHKSLMEILSYTQTIGAMVGEAQAAAELVHRLQQKLQQSQSQSQLSPKALKIYIEEWNEPMICGSRWLSEIVGAIGAIDIFEGQAKMKLGTERIITTDAVIEAGPDIILASWCGKKVDISSILSRPGWENIPAIKNKKVYELSPEIFLQPGIAPIIDGIDIIKQLILKT